MTDASITTRTGWARWFGRGPWENAAMIVIGIGIVMLTQPFSLDLYSYSFVTILFGTIGFVIVSHFPQ
jgi:type IV secretory pathway VirB2 component (pilin)